MGFEMSPQIACLGRCIVTLVAFVQLFSTVVFSNEPSNRIFEKMLVTLQCTGCIHWICIHSLHCHTGCFCLTFSYCAFSNDSSKHLFDNMHSHTSCIFLLLFLLLHSHSNCSCKIVMLAAFVGHLCLFCVFK